jgi:TRAP-type C4-dicarboxylate transport system permease large subunit
MKRLIISLLWSVGIAAMWLVVVVAWAYATIGLFPLTGWTADTTATVVQTGFDLGRWLQSFKEVMEFFRDNYPLILTFIGIVGGIYGAIQHRGKNAAVSALDLMTTSVEIAEGPIPRNDRPVKRQVESAAPVLTALAGRILDASIKRADSSAVPLKDRLLALLTRRGKG